MGQGGAEKIVYQLCTDNTIDEQIVISCGGIYVNKLEKAGVKHYYMPDINSKNPLKIIKCFLCVLYVIRKEKIETLHSHHRMAAFLSRLASFLTGTKSIYTAHNIFNDKYSLTRFSLKSSIIVAVGDSVRKNLIDFFKINESSIITIHNSIKVKTNESGEISLNNLRKKGKRLIGTIGRITKQKGIDVFIKSIDICRLSNPDIVGIIIGDGEEFPQMQYLVKQRKLYDNIIFLGYKNNIFGIIKQLDFIVLASRWEGFPLTPIEVFSQQKTIIASNIPGNSEIITNNINGILFRMDDENELAEKILYLANNKHYLSKLEENAIKTYHEKYDYQKFITAYQKLYRKL